MFGCCCVRKLHKFAYGIHAIQEYGIVNGVATFHVLARFVSIDMWHCAQLALNCFHDVKDGFEGILSVFEGGLCGVEENFQQLSLRFTRDDFFDNEVGNGVKCYGALDC